MPPAGEVHRRAPAIRRAPLAGLLARMRSLRGWNAIVAASVAIVVLVAVATVAGWLSSKDTRTATYSYPSVRQLNLRLSSGEVVIVGSSSSAVEVRRRDDSSFGHVPHETRSYANSVLQIDSACPRIVLGACSAAYEVAVPETAEVDVQTSGGNVRLEDFRGGATVQTGSGNVDAEAYCGFNLSAISQSGHLHVAAACAPEHLLLRTGSGDAVALVPPGHYKIQTSGARQQVTGVTRDPRAPFTLEVRSNTGSATVGGGL